MGFRRNHPIHLATAACVSALALAGCAGLTQRGESTSASTPPSTTTTTTEDRASADSLPEGFPSDVPIAQGTIESTHIEIPGSNGGNVWTLTVTGVDARSYDEAEQLLHTAGFGPADPIPAWTRHPCDRQAQFSKDTPDGGGYVVAICGAHAGPEYTLEYSVNVYPKNNWQIPSLPAPPNLPVPEPPR